MSETKKKKVASYSDLIASMGLEKSVVSKDLKGKTVLVYGDNRTGKTKELLKLPNPIYLGWEYGINAIPGIPFERLNKWSKFKKFNTSLLKKTKDFNGEITLVFDTIDEASLKCDEYICQKHDVDTIGDGNGGFGLWKEYSKEFWSEINRLTGAGFTVAFIAHSGTIVHNKDTDEEYTQIYPGRDGLVDRKRTINPIIDAVDIIGYLKSNGFDENEKEIPSSAFFVNTKTFKAGTRFDYFPEVMEVWSAENLIKGIKDAVEQEEKVTGIESVTFEEQQEVIEEEEMTYDEILAAIKPIVVAMKATDRLDEYQEIVSKYLGDDAKVSEAKKSQVEALDMILSELQELDIEVK